MRVGGGSVRAVAIAVALALLLLQPGVSTQLRVTPVVDQGGVVGLGLMLRKLQSVGTFMMATAHPDDENNGLLAMMSHGRGHRTALVSTTRGEGGQNEIGPELFEALAVLRTEELLAAHRFDGAEQYFLRGVDFGYSFGIEETFERWGREAIVGDFVRMIRTLRPDVIVAMRPDGTGGGQHHQASARLAAEAATRAGDPAAFPEQIAEGLRPWAPRKFYYTARFGFRGEPEPPADKRLLAVDANVYDPLLGRTYHEIGVEGRSMHKCQGMAQLLALPGSFPVRYSLEHTTLPGGKERTEDDLFDGVDTRITSVAAFAGSKPPAPLVTALERIASGIDEAQSTFAAGRLEEVLEPLAQALADVRALRGSLPTMAGLDEAGRFEIDFRLAPKEDQLQQAILLAAGVRAEALAEDGVVAPGQPVGITLLVAARAADVKVKAADLHGFAPDPSEGVCEAGAAAAQPWRCQLTRRVPENARLSTPYFTRVPGSDLYRFEEDAPFGLPFRPTPFTATFDLMVDGTLVHLRVPVQYRYEGNIFSGEKRTELLVVPPFSVRVSPAIAIVPLGGDRREVRVTVTNGAPGAAAGEVSLDVPSGWQVSPQSAPVSFSRPDEEMTVRFTLAPVGPVKPGVSTVTARVRADGVDYTRGFQVIEYPHTRRRHVLHEATVTLRGLDVTVAPDLVVGYVMGVGDEVPAALAQLGVKVEMLDSDALAWGDLSVYDAIATGVRAYERRPDLRANNHRLLDYARQGGVVLVQYNKFEFNAAQYGPYPAKVTSDRVTDERAPVRVLVPEHPLFTFPNRIGEETWEGWVQERGLYFLSDHDPRYQDLVETEDPFPNNAGPKRGALVEARIGKGRWIYIGLGLWRQLPAGTPGAYRLMANLVSVGRSDAASRSDAATP